MASSAVAKQPAQLHTPRASAVLARRVSIDGDQPEHRARPTDARPSPEASHTRPCLPRGAQGEPIAKKSPGGGVAVKGIVKGAKKSPTTKAVEKKEKPKK